MSKIKDIVSLQGKMPEFGLDAIYFDFNTQASAEKFSMAINSTGVKASVLQERTQWKVKIDF
ncbi:hypothetical protein [Acidiplasma cupricumulans]|nr:hypothetical protein [Acidiplasma cupricumulans]